MVSPDPTLSRDIAIVTGMIIAAICSALSPWAAMIGSLRALPWVIQAIPVIQEIPVLRSCPLFSALKPARFRVCIQALSSRSLFIPLKPDRCWVLALDTHNSFTFKKKSKHSISCRLFIDNTFFALRRLWIIARNSYSCSLTRPFLSINDRMFRRFCTP